jgi:hypothetical protein
VVGSLVEVFPVLESETLLDHLYCLHAATLLLR